MTNVLDKLNWRYATKKFDSDKKISEAHLNTLLEAARLSASSYGLQPYHVYVVEKQEIKEQLKPHSWNQSQITDASHLLVFASHINFKEDLVDNYLKNVSDIRQTPHESLEGYGAFMKSKLMPMSNADKQHWASNQVYLALGNVMTIAAELQLDTCPMEGFEPEKYNEILGLNEKNQSASVVLAVGYRSHEDATQHYPKVRYRKEDLITHI
ncbi:NAD(P)H-dependent oxidoreductase [Maribacter sp. 2307ULW6-5]|uniref:NAD(P)H-dependent oxidoreductase n=1 Tax=Maribacter sp. 2307ULW6-5 TaxID=3386275 RepID=UPI0039BC3425